MQQQKQREAATGGRKVVVRGSMILYKKDTKCRRQMMIS